MLHEIDPEVTDTIKFTQFEAILSKDWSSIIMESIKQGESHRNFIVALREKKRKHINSPSTKGVKKEEKDMKEIDKMWEYHIMEELKDQDEEEKAKHSVALSETGISELRQKKN